MTGPTRRAAIAGGLALGFGLATTATAQDVTIRWALHPGAEADAVVNYFAPKYEAETGIKVIGEILPPNQLRDQMSIEAIGKTGRWDLGYHSPGWFGTFKDHVVDLTPLIESTGFDVSKYPPLIVESHMKSDARPGEIIAVPTTPAAPMMIARQDLFEHPDEQAAFKEKYGRDLTVPATYAEWRDVAEFFTRPAGAMAAGETLERPLYGWADALGAGAGITRSYIVVLYSAGLAGWGADFKPDIDNPILLETANWFTHMAQNTAPREAQNWGFLEGLEMFRDGHLATAVMWPQGLGTVEAEGGKAAGNTLYAALPQWEGNLKGYEQGVPFLGGGGVFVFDTPNQQEAFKFLKWMLQDQEIEWGKQSEQFSTTGHFASDELRNLKPYYANFLPAYEKTLQQVFIRQGIPEYGAVMWNGTTEFITDVFSGDLTGEQAQQRWVSSMTEAFTAAGYLK
ncbi:extracellular solute-binding protein [Pseudotabrizicola sediminis]|uniref:Extracellular solute-binding protein n=1 Tax=Pseudotabrizicola sediminis TaxID=2486418 RepID=A0ABY2KJ54_9RHOB|nr:extracellular solute-binding protein [Pseudotabrizicola sediminis]TGD41772.1 extracellular solute-binding protein [Pseudotabrizicola sediminis]